MKALLSVIALVVLSLTALACAQPIPPTATPYPTYTPAPTHTPYPTLAALPTHTPYPTPTPYPTLEPLPTHTPYPTPTALPTYTPYPTATPYPTNTPQPTATSFPTPTPIASHRLYRSDKDRFEVTIPVDWVIDPRPKPEKAHIFHLPNSEGLASIIPLGESSILPLSFYAQTFLGDYKDNLFFELLESNEIDSNRWRTRFQLHITGYDCFLSEIENVWVRASGYLYATTTFSCPSYLEKRGADIDQFHESFRAW